MRKKTPPYKLFDHTADLGCDVFGATRKELFCHAALALLEITTSASAVEVKEQKTITITGADIDDLWINFLRELLYLMNGNGFLIRTVDILNLGRKTISFIAKGEPYNRIRHEILTEVKAVTYHQAGVKKKADGWSGRFIVDV